ncbi:hypothetical protein M067_5112 [Bacteroides fragilis str. J-143-4]|nr:hypothetical protein M067_5112 [Bacteroides fragilis str. J-143-4]
MINKKKQINHNNDLYRFFFEKISKEAMIDNDKVENKYIFYL